MRRRYKKPLDETIDSSVLQPWLEAIPPVDPPSDLRARVLRRVHDASTDLLTVPAGEDGWKSLAPGIDYKILLFDSESGTKSFLLRAEPGVRLPAHVHHGYEECLVLKGEFTLGDLRLRTGDFHCAAKGSRHEVASTETGVLVYLRATLEDYPGVNP